MTRRISDNNLWNFRLGQISHVILSHYILAGSGIRGGVHENNSYCFLLRMANLLIFIHNGGIWKVTIQPRLKNGTYFPCYESLPKGYNVQKWVMFNSLEQALALPLHQSLCGVFTLGFCQKKFPMGWTIVGVHVGGCVCVPFEVCLKSKSRL